MATEQGRQYLEALEEGLEKGAVKVHVTFDETNVFGLAGESLWAEPFESADTFVIDNVPFFMDTPAFGDVVRARREPGTRPGFYEFVEVVTRSQWEWVCAISADGVELQTLLDRVRAEYPSRDDLRVEGGMNGMLAMAVHRDKKDGMLEFLDRLLEEGVVQIIADTSTREDEDVQPS